MGSSESNCCGACHKGQKKKEINTHTIGKNRVKPDEYYRKSLYSSTEGEKPVRSHGNTEFYTSKDHHNHHQHYVHYTHKPIPHEIVLYNYKMEKIVYGYIRQQTNIIYYNHNTKISKDICIIIYDYYYEKPYKPKPLWMTYEFYSNLSIFLKVLPPKSKSHLWDHAVKIKDDNGKSKICDQTTRKTQIVRIISDCIIVYKKYLERKKPKLTPKMVDPFIKDIASFIYERYHPLDKQKFQNERLYFTKMIKDYVDTSNWNKHTNGHSIR